MNCTAEDREQIVKKTFLNMMDGLGYVAELMYMKKAAK